MLFRSCATIILSTPLFHLNKAGLHRGSFCPEPLIRLFAYYSSVLKKSPVRTEWCQNECQSRVPGRNCNHYRIAIKATGKSFLSCAHMYATLSQIMSYKLCLFFSINVPFTVIPTVCSLLTLLLPDTRQSQHNFVSV